MKSATALEILRTQFGFVTEIDINQIIKEDEDCPLIVRCGGGRFPVAAKGAASFIKTIESSGDYVRDVFIPSSYDLKH